MRKRKLAPDSTRDLNWQLEEYERLMGKDKAEAQAELAAKEQGRCLKRRLCRTVKIRGLFWTLHDPECPRWKPAMESIEAELADRRRATTYVHDA